MGSFLFFILMLLFVSKTNAQKNQTDFCGIYEKPITTSIRGVPSIFLREDRFGNKYSVQELLLSHSKGYTTCDAGVFKLTFIDNGFSFFPPNEEATICAAFKEISDNINGGNIPYINIDVIRESDASMRPGVLATASPLFASNCDIVKTDIVNKIHNGPDLSFPELISGYVRIRDVPSGGIPWYTGQTSGLSGSNAYDLFTVVIHEAIHCLGFASSIDMTGGSSVVGKYTYWDKFLVGDNPNTGISGNLLNQTPNTGCCAGRTFNSNLYPDMPEPLNTWSASQQCDLNIGFSDGTSIIAPVNVPYFLPSQNSQMANKLSHLTTTCTTGQPPFIMRASLDREEHFRVMTLEEQSILCQLGYKMDNCKNECFVIANRDDIANPIVLNNGQSTGATITIPFSELLMNDIYASNTISVNLASNCGNTTGIIVTQTPSAFIVEGIQAGVWNFCYSIESCTGDCEVTSVFVRVLNEVTIECEQNDCNAICYGDFERFSGIDNWGLNFANYYPELGIPPVSEVGWGASSPDVVRDDIFENNLLNFAILTPTSFFPMAQTARELIHFPMTTDIPPGCSATISYERFSFGDGVNSNSLPSLTWYGLNEAPCALINSPTCINPNMCLNLGSACMFSDGTVPFVPFQPSQWYFASGASINLEYQEFTFLNNTAAPITDLILYGNVQFAGSTGSVNFILDNVNVSLGCSPSLTVTPTVLDQCINGASTVEYTVCLDGAGTSPITIDLTAFLPNIPGFVIAPGGDFDPITGIGQITLTPNANGSTVCGNITLNMLSQGNIPVGTDIEIELDISSNGLLCVDYANANSDAILHMENCTPDPVGCECPQGPLSSYVIGTNKDSETNASQSGIPFGSVQGGCIAVNGILNWDLSSFPIKNFSFIMGEGAEIIVKGHQRIFWIEDCSFEGCTKMWKGIRTEVGEVAIISAENCTFRDAQYAIQASGHSNLYLVDNDFIDNYIGVLIPDNFGAINNVKSSSIHTNTFTVEDGLLDPYQGQSPNPGQTAFLAFDIYHQFRMFNILHDNNINGLISGIRSENSVINYENSTIENALDVVPASYLIYATDNMVTDIWDNTMTNFQGGVLLAASNLSFEGNLMTSYPDLHFTIGGIKRGILGNNLLGNFVDILDNTINNQVESIYLLNSTGALKDNIRDNVLDNIPTQNPTATSGDGKIALFSSSNMFLDNNAILNATERTGTVGIGINSSDDIFIHDNLIQDATYGISLIGSNAPYVAYNIASNDVNQGTFSNYGFRIENSSSWLCRNTARTDISGHGFNFSGSSPSNFQCNILQEADYGLYLKDNTVIGPQLLRGNQWDVTNNAYGTLGAYFASDDPDPTGEISDSRFLSPQAEIPSWATAAGANGPDWFSQTAVSGSNCLLACPHTYTPPGDGDGELVFNPSSESNGSDLVAAQNGFQTEAMNWMMQQTLYAKLDKNESLLSESEEIESFYQANQHSALGKLALLQKKYAWYLSGTEEVQHEMAQVQIQIKKLTKDLHQAFEENSVENSTVKALQTQLLNWVHYYDAIRSQIKTYQEEQKEVLLAECRGIACPNRLAENERRIVELALEFDLWKGVETNLEVLAEVKAIADLCPNLDGFAVYHARSMYQVYFPETSWDSESPCSQSEGRAEKHSDGIASVLAISLSPNPASERIDIVFSQQMTGDERLIMTSIQGTEVYNIALQKNQARMTLEVGDVSAGLYLLEVLGETGTLVSEKVIITH